MNQSRDYIKRIEALNKGPLQHVPEPREKPASKPRPERTIARAANLVLLEEAVPGIEIEAAGRGKAYLIENRLDDLEEELGELSRAFGNEFESTGSPLRRRLEAVCRRDSLCLEEMMVLDLETTGLGSTPIFLVGTMVWEAGGLVVKQYFARDYGEEPAITSLFADNIVGKRLLVTFNGRSFDMPYLRQRAAAHSVQLTPEPPHLDMLLESRRIWRHRVPNCKLQTLESHICGRRRVGDIPGHKIPAAYHRYVRTGDAAVIANILKHNALDLVTLVDLMLRLPGT